VMDRAIARTGKFVDMLRRESSLSSIDRDSTSLLDGVFVAAVPLTSKSVLLCRRCQFYRV
jgi:hypothetical protein